MRYTLALMLMKGFLVGALMLNAALGSFCMMPKMTMAQEMTMRDGGQPPQEEMNMSMMSPMSPVHCERCTKTDPQKSSPVSTNCPGHCLAKSEAARVHAITVSSDHQIVASIPPVHFNFFYSTPIPQSHATSQGPPIQQTIVESVVMTL